MEGGEGTQWKASWQGRVARKLMPFEQRKETRMGAHTCRTGG